MYKKIVNINQWARSINQSKSMNTIMEERRRIREEKISEFQKRADGLLDLIKKGF